MTAIRKSGGSNVALTTLKRRSGSSWVAVQRGYRFSGGTWVQVYSAAPSITASASPSSVSGSTATAGQNTGTNATTATLTGATATGYSWSRESGDTSITINAPNAATTGFTGAPNRLNPTRTATFACTITYSGGQVTTNTVTATLTYTGV